LARGQEAAAMWAETIKEPTAKRTLERTGFGGRRTLGVGVLGRWYGTTIPLFYKNSRIPLMRTMWRKNEIGAP
jgi:hypothetical protein